MFTIAKTPEFSHTVKIRVPVDGGFEDQELVARFRVIPWSEIEASDRDPAEQLRRVWVGWEGVVDEAGKPVPFSNDARDMLIDRVYVRRALTSAYSRAVTGAVEGN